MLRQQALPLVEAVDDEKRWSEAHPQQNAVLYSLLPGMTPHPAG